MILPFPVNHAYAHEIAVRVPRLALLLTSKFAHLYLMGVGTRSSDRDWISRSDAASAAKILSGSRKFTLTKKSPSPVETRTCVLSTPGPVVTFNAERTFDPDTSETTVQIDSYVELVHRQRCCPPRRRASGAPITKATMRLKPLSLTPAPNLYTTRAHANSLSTDKQLNSGLSLPY